MCASFSISSSNPALFYYFPFLDASLASWNPLLLGDISAGELRRILCVDVYLIHCRSWALATSCGSQVPSDAQFIRTRSWGAPRNGPRRAVPATGLKLPLRPHRGQGPALPVAVSLGSGRSLELVF